MPTYQFEDEAPKTPAAPSGWTFEDEAPEPSSLIRRGVVDPLVGLAKGTLVGIPETLVGLADIPTMGYAGKGVEAVTKGLGLGGFKEANQAFTDLLSPETQEAQRKVSEAKGFLPTIQTALQNPSAISQVVAESIPAMVAGTKIAGMGMKALGYGVGAKGITAADRLRRAGIAGGLGEGVVTAGQNLEQVRQETPEGLLTPGQVGLNVASGAVTGLIGVMGGKLAARLGLEDINTLIAGGKSGVVGNAEKSIFKKVLYSAIQEGVLEELPQSMQEQIAQNLSLGKPIDEGVVEAGAIGMLAGFAQSTGAQAGGKILSRPNPVEASLQNDPLNQEIAALENDPSLAEEMRFIAPPEVPPEMLGERTDKGLPRMLEPEPIAPVEAEPIVSGVQGEDTFIPREQIGEAPVETIPTEMVETPAEAIAPAPSVFTRMPDEQLQQMADQGVRGAIDEVAKRAEAAPDAMAETPAPEIAQPEAAGGKQAWEGTVYRGKGEKPADAGDLGIGEYSTTSEASAKQYGVVSQGKVSLRNPLRLTADEAGKLADDYGTLQGSAEARKAASTKLTNDLQAKGHDGIVVDGYDTAGTTVVKFPSPLPEAGATTPTTEQPLRYDPSKNRHNGEKLTPGDMLRDNEGNTYRLDRDSGFMLTVDQIKDGEPVGIKSFSVDPSDKVRFKDLYRTGENAFDSIENITGVKTTPTTPRNAAEVKAKIAERKVIPTTKTAETAVTTPKEQKAYVLDKVDGLIVAARDRFKEQTAAPKEVVDKDIDENIIKGRFASEIPPTGAETVTIEVPNDGNFKIPNTLRGLLTFQRNMKRMSTSTTPSKGLTPPGLPSNKPTGKTAKQFEAEYEAEAKAEAEAIKAARESAKSRYVYLRDEGVPNAEADAAKWVAINDDITEKKRTLKSIAQEFRGKAPTMRDVNTRTSDRKADAQNTRESLREAEATIRKDYPSLAKEMFGETKGETVNEDMARRSKLQIQASKITNQATGVSNAGLLTKDATVRPERNQSDYPGLREELVLRVSPASGNIDFQTVQIDGKNADFIKGLAGIFGKKVQFFRSETPEINNVLLGFVDQRLAPDTIFLNIQSPAPHLQTLGHELMHQLQTNDPELYQNFLSEIKSYAPTVGVYKTLMIKNKDYVNDAQMLKEFTAEFIEHRFMDQKFWDGMIEKNPSVFSRVLQYITDILNKVKEYVEQGRDIDKSYINDLDKARQVAINTLTKYRKSQGLSTTKEGIIRPTAYDKWNSYDIHDTIRTAWKTKIQEATNERERATRENRNEGTGSDTRRGGVGVDLSSDGRLQRRRLFDNQMQGINSEPERQRWGGVRYSSDFEGTVEYMVAAEHFRSLGYETVPITSVDWHGAVNTRDKVMFLGESYGDKFAYAVSHETSHILTAQNNAAAMEVKNKVNVKHPLAQLLKDRLKKSDDYIRDEITASLIGGDPQYTITMRGSEIANQPIIKKARDTATNPGKQENMYGDVTPGTWDAPEVTRTSEFIRSFVDRNVYLRKTVEAIQKAVGVLKDEINPDIRERLFTSTVSEKTKNYLEKEFVPLMKDMQRTGVTIDEQEEYLWYRTASETNAYLDSLMDELDPKSPESARREEFRGRGSGKSQAQIEKYFAELSPQRRSAYEKLAERTDKMLAENRKLVVDYQLESQTTVDKWSAAYPHYAPLFREDAQAGIGTGEGFSVTGPTSKRRKGSQREVVDILAHIAEQRETIITKGEKNRIGIALHGLAKASPNPDFWKVAKPRMIKGAVNEITGEPVVDLSYRHDKNVIMSRQLEKGRIVERGVEFNPRNEAAMKMAEAMKNMDMDNLGTFLGISAKITRFIASMNTQYNPVFGITNFVRDVQFAMLSISESKIAGKQKQVMSYTMPAMKAIYADLRNKGIGDVAEGSMGAWWRDFAAHGGPTGFRDIFRTTKDRADQIRKEMAFMDTGTTVGKIYATKMSIQNWLSDYNGAMENAVRLSAYRVAVESGISKDQAAVLAKSLTVDFNKKGQIATQAGAMYAFFNASAQGIAQMVKVLQAPAGKKILAGGITAGAVQAMMLVAAGFDDKDIPEFIRERNFIIPTGGKDYVLIPMPLGFNAIANLGRIPTEFALGGFKDPLKRTTDLLGIMAESFNPLGGSGLSLQTVTPTVLDPFVALSANKDWTGKPIFREDFSSMAPKPGLTRTKDSASWFSKKLAWAFNKISGGSEHVPGMFSPTGDEIDYLMGQVTGGLGREALKIASMVEAVQKDTEIPPYRIPLVGRFYGSTEGQANEASRFYGNLKTLNRHEDEIKGRRKSKEPLGDYLKENPEARYWVLGNRVGTSIARLTDRKRHMVERGASNEAVNNLNTLITSHMRRFNDTIKRAEL